MCIKFVTNEFGFRNAFQNEEVASTFSISGNVLRHRTILGTNYNTLANFEKSWSKNISYKDRRVKKLRDW